MRSRRSLAVRSLLAVALAAGLAAAVPTGTSVASPVEQAPSAGKRLSIEVLSGRADLVSGGSALVAITQTSIVGPRERRLSPKETARLQGLPDWFDFGDQRPAASYKQMGNGVNVGAVWHVMREHVNRDADVLKRTAAGRRILDAVQRAPLSPDGVLKAMGPAHHG